MLERYVDDPEYRLSELRRLAAQFRRALERCSADDRPPNFHGFPTGTCGDASELLAKYLGDRGMGVFHYVCGWQDGVWVGHSHGWLEQDGVTVDITADQFEGQDQAVLVTIGSEWHRGFEREIDHEASWDDAPAELKIAYLRLARLADAEAGTERHESHQETPKRFRKDTQK